MAEKKHNIFSNQKNECNESDYKKCDAMNRLLSALRRYTVFMMTDNEYYKDIFLLFMNNLYNYKTVLDDYNHFKQQHLSQLEDINDALIIYINRCDSKTCKFSTHHQQNKNPKHTKPETKDPKLPSYHEIFCEIRSHLLNCYETAFRVRGNRAIDNDLYIDSEWHTFCSKKFNIMNINTKVNHHKYTFLGQIVKHSAYKQNTTRLQDEHYRSTSEWRTMPDVYVVEHIRDLLEDNNITIKGIDERVREFVYQRLDVHDLDIERMRNIMTELRKQEGEYDINLSNNDIHINDNKEFEDELLTFDELTPETYKKKQEELTATDKYKSIRNEYLQKMLQNLNNCDKNMLLQQCTNDHCDNSNIFDTCESVKRIDILLSLYHELMNCNTLWRKVAMDRLIYIKDKYNHQQIFNDFLHIKLYHIDIDNELLLKQEKDRYQNIAKSLHDRFSTFYPCNGIQTCFAFRRHYRDRADRDTEKAMFHTMENDENNKALSIRNEKEWILQEECDKIHSYFLHSTIQFPNTDLYAMKPRDIDSNEQHKLETISNTIDKISKNALGRSFSDADASTLTALDLCADTLEIEQNANKAVDEINNYALGRSFSANLNTNPSVDTTSAVDKVIDLSIEKHADEALPVTATTLTTSESENAVSEKKKKSGRGYVGEKEDEKWFEQIEEEQNDDALYRLLVQNMGVFRWQSAHGFRTGQNRGLAHLKPKWNNIKQEALHNSYSQASIDNWNSTLRKSKIFYNSFARHRIRTLYESQFIDEVTDTNIKWKAGQSILLAEIVMLKLYTDFDKLQHELKKCFRWETIGKVVDKQVDKRRINPLSNNDDEHKKMLEERDEERKRDLENRLREFWHWRISLLQTLNKYGKKINERDMILYHGVNSKMILDPSESMNFYGPLSTTSSYHVAKTFATAKGMVLKITSQYPRLDICRAFDASLISDYPEEQEYLIGFLYMRVVEIRTRPIVADIMDKTLWNKAPLASRMRVLFFAIHLFGEQMFSMSKHLEYYLVEFLKCHRKDCCQHKDSLHHEQKQSFLSFLCCEIVHHEEAITKPKDWKDTKSLHERRVLKILWKKFRDFRLNPNFKQAIKIDTISDGLKEFFLKRDKRIKKDVYGNTKYNISFRKLLYIYPDIKEVHYINNYRFDDDALSELIYLIERKFRGKLDGTHQSRTSGHNIHKKQQQKNNKNNKKTHHQSQKSFPIILPQSVSAITPEPHAADVETVSVLNYNSVYNIRNLRKVVFVYYDYEDEIDEKENIKLGHPQNGDKFFHPNKLDKNKVKQLQDLNWIIKYNKNGNTGFKIRIQEHYDPNKERPSFAMFHQSNKSQSSRNLLDINT